MTHLLDGNMLVALVVEDLAGVVGHRQVTDAYLAQLAPDLVGLPGLPALNEGRPPMCKRVTT